MWPFRKRSKADRVNDILDDAIELTAQRWIYFNENLAFQPDTSLREIVEHFREPMTKGLKNSFNAFDDETPSPVFLLVIVKAIQKSGSHSKPEIEAALGIKIPD